jgi:hypothetical protein
MYMSVRGRYVSIFELGKVFDSIFVLNNVRSCLWPRLKHFSHKREPGFYIGRRFCKLRRTLVCELRDERRLGVRDQRTWWLRRDDIRRCWPSAQGCQRILGSVLAMPINYKRWDSLHDSSDEDEPSKPQAASPRSPAASASSSPPASPNKPSNELPSTTLSGVVPDVARGRAAVCSTMKDVQHRITSWVRWHLHIGFERLYIFFDDASETESVQLARAAGGSAVVALMRDSDVLKNAWKRTPSWQGMGKDADKDVQIRQLLNAQLAMDMSRSAGLTWLLHMCAHEHATPRAHAHPPAPA